MTLYKFISENKKDLLRLQKNGIISTTILSHHEVYKTYLSYGHLKSKMLRYECTAEDSRLKLRSVIKIVKSMERPMR